VGSIGITVKVRAFVAGNARTINTNRIEKILMLRTSRLAALVLHSVQKMHYLA